MLSDTSEEFQQLYWKALRRQTPAQRLNQAVELSNAVRSLFLANIRHLDEVTQRRLLAEACYGVEAAQLLEAASGFPSTSTQIDPAGTTG